MLHFTGIIRFSLFARFVTNGINEGRGFKLELTALGPHQSSDYILIGNPEAQCNHITTLGECNDAARQLGLADTKATIDLGYFSGSNPPYCYFNAYDDSLMFNENGTNTGSCNPNMYDRCVCHR